MPLDTGCLELYQNLFNAIPLPIFIVDADVNIQYMNRAAIEAYGLSERFYNMRGGDALICINSTKTPAGCGHSEECADCVIRNSVLEAFKGGRAYKRRMAMTTLKEGRKVYIQLLITTSPFFVGEDKYSLLILEDISELLKLRSLLPICAWCRKIRNDENYWQTVEEYFKSNFEIDFTHGICDECYKKCCDEQSSGEEN